MGVISHDSPCHQVSPSEKNTLFHDLPDPPVAGIRDDGNDMAAAKIQV
jgi:hypothetical protein